MPGLPCESIDVIRAVLGDDGFCKFCRGNALKYLIRADHKGGTEDLEKAVKYIDWERDTREGTFVILYAIFAPRWNTYYQATQKQRAIERELRELKRRYIGGRKELAGAIKAKEQQYARYCEKAGLKQNLNRLYVKGYKRDFQYIERKTLEYPAGSGNIIEVQVRSGHKGNPRKGEPNSIVDRLALDGSVSTRTHYNNNGQKDWELHTTNHGNAKMHNYGQHGEHMHEFSWDENGQLIEKSSRELTTIERKTNEDIL